MEVEQQQNKQNAPPNKKIRPFLVVGIAVLIAIAIVLGLMPRLAQWKKIEQIAADPKLPSVTIMEVKAETKPTDLVLPSTTEGMHITPIWARTDGYLSEFLVDIGDNVKEGQLLAVIDTPEVDKQLLQARADLQSSIAKLEIARISAQRWEDLYTRNAQAVSRQEVDERNASLRSAQADVNAAQENVNRLEKIKGFQQIYAPFDGTIIQRNIDVGSLITAGSNGNPQQLFKIAQMNTIRVFVNVPQSYFRLIKEGVTTDVFVREFPSRTFKGTVARTAGALDPIARTLLTEIHIDNSDRALLVGLYAEVHFSLIPDVPYFIIPTQALVIHTGDPRVALVDDNGNVSLVTVTLGRDFGKTIEVTSGLKQNDKLIINPSERIKRTTKVQVTNTVNPTQAAP